MYLILVVFFAIALVLGFFYLFQEYLIFHPIKLSADFKFTYEAEERFVEVAKGVRLNALHFKTDNARGVVLYFHGNAGNLSEWGSVSENFLPLGYDVFVYDYRGYGKSQGKIRTEHELHSDAEAMLALLAKEYPADKIILFGRSLGSGMAVRLAAKHKVKALLLESPYFNLADIGRVHYPFIPVRFLLRYPLRNDLYLPQVRCPVYIVHGTADEVIPWQSGRKLAGQLPSSKMLVIDNGDHNNLSTFMIYREFLAEAFK